MALGRQIGGTIGEATTATGGPDAGSGAGPTGPDESAEHPRHRPPGRGTRLWIALAAVLALALTFVVAFRWGSNTTTASGGPGGTSAPSTTATSSTGPLSPAAIYSAALPSLVYITVKGGSPSGPTGDPIAPSTAPSGSDKPGQAVGIGTGLVINAAGQVLTANHVVSGATGITLTFADGTTSTATVADSDPSTDTATLTPATLPSPIVPAVVGSADTLAVGDPVVAIGNPLGLAASTSSGVVSGLGRSAPGNDDVTLTGLIQFDAAVNPGNSGGPLLNSRGQAVGIVVELLNASGDDSFAGIGLAVPIGTALAGGGGGRPPQK